MEFKKRTFVGYGELIYDHYFHKNNDVIYYHHSNGGGTVWNVLSTLSDLGHECIALGAYGNDDPYGEFAKNELSNFNIDVSNVHLQKNKKTNIIFQELNINNKKHTFKDKCIVCGSSTNYSKLAKSNRINFRNFINWKNVDGIIIDKLTKDRIELIEYAKQINPQLIAVYDFGRTGYLRYIPTPKILDNLKDLDIIFFNDKAFNSINNRIKRYYNNTSVIDLLVSEKLDRIFIVTRAQYGLDIIFGDKVHKSLQPTQTEQLIDTSGAGDNLIAFFLNKWSQNKPSLNDKSLVDFLNKSNQELEVVLSNYGTRSHLKNYYYEKEFKRFKDLTIQQIKKLTIGQNCPFCDNLENNNQEQIKQKNKVSASISKTISDLSKRLLFIFDNNSALELTKSLTYNLEGKGYVIGTGGSFSSALFISQVLNKHSNSFSTPIKPLDFLSSASENIDFIIIISYSGSTSDFFPVLKKANELGLKSINIVTHSKSSKLEKALKSFDRIFVQDIIVVYSGYSDKKERGFLSISGTLLPSMLFFLGSSSNKISTKIMSNLLSKIENRKYEKLAFIVNEVKDKNIIEVFGGGYSWPAVLDFESKIIESGMFAVVNHEYKDFSHGRFMYTLKSRNPKIIFLINPNEYERRLVQILSEESPLLVIQSENIGLFGGIELLIEVQYLIYKLSQEFNSKIDISKPNKVPQKGLELYRWNLMS